MTVRLLLVAAVVGISASFGVSASDRVDHFEGKSAETLEEAVTNFSAYNQRLEGLLSKNTLTQNDLFQIHELTYTLENALEKINADLAGLADTLEELHVASETGDIDGAKRHGGAYLDTARKVIP